MFLWIVRAAILAMVALVVVNVIARKVFGESFTWSNELVVDLLMPIVVFLAASRAFRDGALLRMTSFSSKFPPRVKHVLDLVFDSVGITVWAVIAWKALETAIIASSSAARIGVFAIPSWLSFGIVGVGCLFLTLEMVAHVALSGSKNENDADTDARTLEGAI